MDTSTGKKLAKIVSGVEALPIETQELLVAEFEDRLDAVSASALSAGQQAEIERRLSTRRRHVTDDDVRRVLRTYNPDL